MKIYKIRDWDSLFETCETKKLKKLHWVPIPNKHDGKSYRRIAQMKNGCEILSAWLLIVQIASKCSPRGTLIDGSVPIDSEDMAIMTGFPEKIFQEAIKVLSNGKIDWIEPVDSVESPGVAGDHPGVAGEPAAEGKEGNEWKEGKKSENMGYKPGDVGSTEGFNTFWELYPKSKDKDGCRKAWGRLNLSREKEQEILIVLRERIKGKDWIDSNGKYIPNPLNWIEKKGWEDKIKVNGSTVKLNLISESEMPKI